MLLQLLFGKETVPSVFVRKFALVVCEGQTNVGQLIPFAVCTYSWFSPTSVIELFT